LGVGKNTNKMNIQDFKLVKNRQRPEFCYAYEKYNKDKSKKYSIFTMNGGRSFLASITSKNNLGKLVDTDFSETFNSVDESLKALEEKEALAVS
tara:strand:- start:824 stop:1105 length:282 start_codon:yes stop_codon:yes gene_type:complete